MPQIYILSDIGEGNKLDDIPSSRYLPSRTELENQLACANQDREIAIECGNRFANKCSILDKDNKHIQCNLKQSNNDKEKLFKHTYQLINEDIIRLKKIKSLQSINKILKSKLASAQKDAFSTQKEIVKKESVIISLKSELINIKNELINTKDELASKIKKIEYLVALISVLQKTKDILDPVESKTYCSAIVMGGSLFCRPFKGDSLSHKSLVKYFKSKTLPIITNNQNSKSLIQDITNKQNPESLIQDITNKQNPESLIQDITIKETVCTSEALVNDKYPISSFIKIVIIPDYSYHMTASDNLFSGIYSQSEGTNVPKLTINEQSKKAVLRVPNSSDIQKNQKKELLQNKPEGQTKDYGSSSLFSKKMSFTLPSMKLYLMNIDEANKHKSIRNVGHPAMSWPFSKVFTGISGKDKTNIVGNLVLGDKAENIYKGKKEGSRYIKCDDLIVCGFHLDKPKWAFVRYMYGVIAGNPKAPYYENIRFKYISPKKIPSVKSFFPERSTNISPIYITQKYHHVLIIIRENFTHLVIFNGGSSYQDVSKIIGRYTNDVKNASMVINSYLLKNEFIVFDLTRSEDDPLAIHLRFDTLLDLQKEIELRQKHKIKNALPAEFMNSEPKKTEKSNK
ncbi:1773_t:CDS:2 [Cetraspora pellucida]|uniref:1773_t:CDS:1 n=1 Tax=Cetraspora pellucida TaxID=1433469 RepID=A0A9N9GK99_9GLOM|nr:1773_t:CDS:2 [Cetraspora pellucida]